MSVDRGLAVEIRVRQIIMESFPRRSMYLFYADSVAGRALQVLIG